MRLKSFHGKTMDDAMRQIRIALGDEAVILSTRRGKNGVEITAAVEEEDVLIEELDPLSDDHLPEPIGLDALEDELEERSPYAPAKKTTSKQNAPEKTPVPKTAEPTATKAKAAKKKPGGTSAKLAKEMSQTFAHTLRFHNTPRYLSEQLCHHAVSEAMDHTYEEEDALAAGVLAYHFDFHPIRIEERVPPVMLIGPPGVGKTMTIAKMAAEAVVHDVGVTVITTDTHKAGGIEQLRAFTDILEIELHEADDPKALRSLLKRIPKEHLVLIDTPGANPYDTGALQELGAYVAVEDIDPTLVINAGMDVLEAGDVASNFAYLGATKLIVTKIDATRRLGGLLVAAHSGNMAFSHFSRNPGAADGLEAVSPKHLASLLLGYEQGQSVQS